jgi:5-aminolevulinate synthase
MNLNYNDFFKKSIDDLKLENRYREFVNLERICGEFPYAINKANNKKIIIWCSNDYLGMGQNPLAINKAQLAISKFGIGAGGTRNISGNSYAITELENLVAKLHNKDAGLVFSSGYVANDASIQALVKIIPELIIFSESKNHASIIAGIRNSLAKKHIFQHNNIDDLHNLIKSYPLNHPKLIVFESVYSMDGDFGNIYDIIEIAKKYNALTYIDEVHAVGLYGKNGAGKSAELNLQHEIDIIQGTFAKGYGAIGGYISASDFIVDAIRSSASPFIFSTAMPPAIASAIISNVKHLMESSIEREKLFKNVAKIKQKLLANNIKIVDNNSHIISIKIGDALKAKLISTKLLNEYNIYIQHINYPTVAKGDERLRLTASSLHDDKMIDDLILALTQVINKIL